MFFSSFSSKLCFDPHSLSLHSFMANINSPLHTYDFGACPLAPLCFANGHRAVRCIFWFIPLCFIPQKDAAPIPGARNTANLGGQPLSGKSISLIFLFLLPIGIGYFFQEDFLFTMKQDVTNLMKESKPEIFFALQTC